MSTANFRAKSHILTLLGDELIGNDALAIFELVKNSYDADADNVYINFENLGANEISLTIKDDGHGMDESTIRDVWLTLGTDYKRGENRKPSRKYKRISLGNKGIGRLAVHKIATKIELTTKVLNKNIAHRVSIDWKKLIDSEDFVQELEVDIKELKIIDSKSKEIKIRLEGIERRIKDIKQEIKEEKRKDEIDIKKAELNKEEAKLDEFKLYISEDEFPKGQGTIIHLENFKDLNWTKSKVRNFYRQIESIKSPFVKIENFNINIDLADKQDWIADLDTYEDILNKKLYYFRFKLSPTKGEDNDTVNFSWDYSFQPQEKIVLKNGDVVEPSTVLNNKDVIDIEDKLNYLYQEDRELKRCLQNKDLKNIGEISGEFFVYNLDKHIFNIYFEGQTKAVKSFIKDNYGVKIYRDGMRVFNYGESNDDWLDLDYSKIQRSGDHFARKVTLGAIYLNLNSSENGLIEKTNREGFTENESFEKLKFIVKRVFQKFESVSRDDKQKINEFIDGFKPVKKIGLSETVEDLRTKIEEKGLTEEFKPIVDRVVKDYNEMRDIMLNSGMSGLNLGIVFHEVDRELKRVDSELDALQLDAEKLNNIKFRVKSLVSILGTFTPILQNKKDDIIEVKSIIEMIGELNHSRFDYHNVIFSSPLLTSESKDFKVKGQGNLIFTAVNNLIDNAIYWLGYNDSDTNKGIYITTDLLSFNGNAVIIADNGPGFSIDEEVAFQPFVTSKQEGMGLGLYLSNLVLESIGGSLLVVDSNDYNVPNIYSGACLAMVFPSTGDK